ncbi:hypothetical protein BDV26DRAFT_273914, partial [Aspergillus bertholletiae]
MPNTHIMKSRYMMLVRIFLPETPCIEYSYLFIYCVLFQFILKLLYVISFFCTEYFCLVLLCFSHPSRSSVPLRLFSDSGQGCQCFTSPM